MKPGLARRVAEVRRASKGPAGDALAVQASPRSVQRRRQGPRLRHGQDGASPSRTNRVLIPSGHPFQAEEAGATFRDIRKNPMTRAGASAYMWQPWV